MSNYLEVTQEQGRQFFINYKDKGTIVMLNLLRFKEVADYTGLASIKPEMELSGKDAYELYMKLTMPFLQEAGSKLLFSGECDFFAIGPDNVRWDMVLLVEHQSVQKFMEFARNEAYLKIAGHRTAALEDSRLLPISGM